jgi:hypothetical protein
MHPTHERFEAFDGAGGHRDVGLVLQPELLRIKTAAQVTGQLEAPQRGGAHRRLEDTVGVSAGRFGVPVGGHNISGQLVSCCIASSERDPDIHGKRDLLVAELHRLRQLGDDPVRQDVGLSGIMG